MRIITLSTYNVFINLLIFLNRQRDCLANFLRRLLKIFEGVTKINYY